MHFKSIVYLCLILSQLTFSSQLCGANLLENSGFENGTLPWEENNWQKNEARFIRDTDNPHSGKHAYKMQLIKAKGGTILQCLYPNVPFKPRQTIRLGYWARGVSNGAALHVYIRLGEAPWTSYFHAESKLLDQWKSYEHTLTLPSYLPEKNVQIMFQLRELGTVWLDDVTITELPVVEQGKAPTQNPVRNASFEVGRDGWTATFRQRDFGTPREESGSNSPSPEGVDLLTTQAADAPHGQSYLSLHLPVKSFCFLTSGYFSARYGHSMRLRFSLKADGQQSFVAGIASGKNANTRWDGARTYNATTHWQTYDIPLTLRPADSGVYCVSLRFEQAGDYDIDAVSLTEAEHPDVTLFAPSVAITPVTSTPMAHLFSQHQNASFQLQIAGYPVGQSQSFTLTVTDYLNHKKTLKTVRIEGDAKGMGQVVFNVPTAGFGAFLIEARQALAQAQSLKPLLAEQVYCVLPVLPQPSERPDSFFGGHFDMTTYNMEIARRAGFRWLRLYPPLITQWMAVEHTPGNWLFRVPEVVLAKTKGFKILGNLGTTPDFAADLDPQNKTITRWTRSYPPAEIQRWQDYVTRTVNAFGDNVDAWEIWNEPDGSYMQLRPDRDKTQVYMDMLKAARQAVDATGRKVFLMGPAISSINESLGWELLEHGAGQYLDAFSFHHYSLSQSGNSPDTSFINPLLTRYASHQNRQGKILPLWHTEGGIYLSGSQSWLATYRIPHSSSVSPALAAASMVRAALYFKASGVKRYFDYQLGTSRAGRKVHEDITCGFIEVTGIPSLGIAAHAAMVKTVEDSTPAGYESRTINKALLHIAHFDSDLGEIDAYWSNDTIALSDILVPKGQCQVYDMMGNPIALKDAQVNRYPIYVLTKAGK